MVHLPTLNILTDHMRDNLPNYYKNNPGKYVLLTLDDHYNVVERFFDTEEARKKVIPDTPCYCVKENIPKESHRFNEGNKNLEFRLKEHVTVCPNDGKTELKPAGLMGGTDGYKERAECPDCGCTVWRKPSDELIKAAKKSAEKLVFGYATVYS